MSFDVLSKIFHRGDKLYALDLNNIVKRIERLEKVFSGNLHLSNSEGGISWNLPNNIPDIEFAYTSEEITDDQDRLFTAILLDQTQEIDELEVSHEVFGPIYDDETVTFRNIFHCTEDINKPILLIRFPRGNGEYIWIPKACN